ncbi:MAG TPA: prepilin-type N-terminal cleavage/methylation domain-containing protein [Gemmatimonadota bacterium]|nr:prepilin-type N-terminal cleavage/methylation domain-containing protein [Gemmatimonadota bacterium]
MRRIGVHLLAPVARTGGFTLVELLLAMTLTGVLGMAAVRLFVVQHQAFVRQGEGIRRTQNARAGFDLMTREMRNAGYDPRGTAAAGVTRWSAEAFGWTADLDADGAIAGDGERVEYLLAEDGTLIRREDEVGVAVAEHVTELRFTYFADPTETPATSADEIELIAVRLAYDVPQGATGAILETRVALRNRVWR